MDDDGRGVRSPPFIVKYGEILSGQNVGSEPQVGRLTETCSVIGQNLMVEFFLIFPN